MARAMAKAGVSITITSFTDAIAFVLGTTSQLPALSAFCGFAAVGIAADFLLQARPTMATYHGAIHYGATYYGATYYGATYSTMAVAAYVLVQFMVYGHVVAPCHRESSALVAGILSIALHMHMPMAMPMHMPMPMPSSRAHLAWQISYP